MTFFGILLALTVFNSPQVQRDTALQVPASSQFQPFAPPDSVKRHLVEMTNDQEEVHDLATRAALAGAGFVAIAALAWVTDVVVHDLAADPEDATERPHPVLTLAKWTAGIGAACEIFAAGAGIYSMVLSHRIEAYEHKTRYRLSLEPAILPRERALGMVARVGF